MSEASLELERDLFEETAVRPALFYVVSKRKFVILFVATMGLYGMYWHYKQWSCFKAANLFESISADFSPVVRGLFGVFFIHSLLGQVKRHGRGAPTLAEWKPGIHATLLIVTLMIYCFIERLAWLDIGGPITDYLSLIAMLPLLFFYYDAQRAINVECGDPEGMDNRKLDTANYAWIVSGLLLWLFFFWNDTGSFPS